MKTTKQKIQLSLKIILFSVTLLLFSFFSYTVFRIYSFSKTNTATALSQQESLTLHRKLNSLWPEKYKFIKKTSYNLIPPSLSVEAESAILIDFSNGNILYEKNADEIIPPASMTKLFAMYVVEHEISKGNFSYDQIIPLPPESWACNMPPRSSLMFLGKDQIVTLEELILGLSICSGNDAAYALAYTISGSMEAFVERMNQIAIELGLKNTHFVESSGYSELNTTTAREMAIFSRVYLTEHPDSIKKFHSKKDFTYPKEHNLAPGDIYAPQDWSNGLPEHITMGITQKNTNPLLGLLEGCDGLKTGYIDESGYNLSLTAERNGIRYISVTMKGPGTSTKEGQANRIKDGTELMEYAFSNFAPFTSPDFSKTYTTKCFGSKEKVINLVPAFTVESVSIPLVLANSPDNYLDDIEILVEKPSKLGGNIIYGNQYGTIYVKMGEYILETIPLVADRSTTQTNFITKCADTIASIFFD